MSSFGKSSLSALRTADPRLQQICYELIPYVDFRVMCGHRSPEEQLKAFNAGKSKVRFGKHNFLPSKAIDVSPWPIVWGDTGRFRVFAGQFLLMAKMLVIPIRWGGDWDRDTFTTDQEFNDLVHFEIYGE